MGSGSKSRNPKESVEGLDTHQNARNTCGSMRTNNRSNVRNCPLAAKNRSDIVMLTTFLLTTILYCKSLALPVALLSLCITLSWQAGQIAGLLASIVSAGLLLALRGHHGNIKIGLCFLLFCSTMSWLVASLRQRWNMLERERDEIRMMLDRAPIGIALFDTNRKVLRCNPAFHKIYGFSDEDIIGIIPPLPESQRESLDELLARLRSGKSFVSVETVRAQKDGTQFYARVSGSPVFGLSDNLIGLVGLIAKVDDGGYSDQLELRNLESLVQSSSDFMCVTHLDRRALFINDAGRNLVGLPYDADLGDLPLEELFVEEDRARLTEMLRILPNQRVGLITHTLHLKQRQTGQPVAMTCSFFVITDPLTKEDSSFACVAKPVGTAPKRIPDAPDAEEAFQSLFRNAPVAIALVDRAGVPFESNVFFQQMLGYDAENLRQMQFSQLVHPEDLPAGRKMFLSLIGGEIDRYQLEKRLIAKTGSVLFTKMTVVLMRDRSGMPSYSISMIELQLKGGPLQSRT